MNLNPVDWSKAQELLRTLVQVLTPLTDRPDPISVVISKRFFSPSHSASSPLQLKHPIRILSTLHSVQKTVNEIIGEPPPKPESIERPKPNELPKNPVSQPLISKQAKKLIDQVQEAIANLCSSTNMKDPKEAPLREALKRLKPELDRLIHVVAEEGKNTTDEGNHPAYRPSIPNSAREETLKKAIFIPETKTGQKPTTASRSEVKSDAKSKLEKEVEVKTETKSEVKAGEKRESSDFVPPAKIKKTLLSQKEKEPIESPKKGETKGSEPISLKSHPQSQPKSQPTEQAQLKQEQRIEKPHIVERTSIPIVPFLPQTRPLTPAAKKKKRKGFWFREKEEERDNP